MMLSWILDSFGVLACALAANAANGPASQPVAEPVAGRSTGELIDSLTQVTNVEFSVRTNVFAGNALPQGLLMLQDAPPTPTEAAGELRRRGGAALPELLAHLDDARKTKATVQAMFGGFKFSAEYDWNPQSGHELPKGVLRTYGSRRLASIVAPRSTEYSVTVGDLCFEIVGDIVNRRYQAIRYQPTAIVVVNSPVLCHELCDAVRQEWAGITEQLLRDSLVRDVTAPDSEGHDARGLIALLRYYPDSAAAAVRRRLDVPEFDSNAVYDFSEQKLIPMSDSRERKKLINDYVALNGKSARDGLILRIWRDRSSYLIGHQTSSPGPEPTARDAPEDILKSLIGEYNQEYPPAVESVSSAATVELIKALGDFPSTEIDQALWERFQKETSSHSQSEENSDTIAFAAVKRLAHKGHDPELAAYCNRRYAEITETWAKKRLGALIKELGY